MASEPFSRGIHQQRRVRTKSKSGVSGERGGAIFPNYMITENGIEIISEELPRYSIGAPCPCGGYGDTVEDLTKEEIEEQDCTYDFPCCIAAFVCRICKKRFLARLEAPDCKW